MPNLSEVLQAALVNGGAGLAAGLVSYGALRAQVAGLSKELGHSSRRIETLETLLSQHRVDMHAQFVSLETFRELKREMTERHDRQDAQLSKLLDLVGEIRASIRVP